MANAIVPEVPADNKQEPLPKPLEFGPGHPGTDTSFQSKVAAEAGVAKEDVTPPDAVAQEIAEGSIKSYLKDMGALEPETTISARETTSEFEKIAQDVGAFNPFVEETSRIGDADPFNQVVEKRKLEKDFEKEKKAA